MQHKAKMRSKFLVSMFMMLILLMNYIVPTFAIEEDNRNVLTPTDTQFLEMRATEIKELVDGSKQVIIELWAHDLIFKRL